MAELPEGDLLYHYTTRPPSAATGVCAGSRPAGLPRDSPRRRADRRGIVRKCDPRGRDYPFCALPTTPAERCSLARGSS